MTELETANSRIVDLEAELAEMRATSEPVARIKRLESRGACLEWYADWSDLMVGDHLYIRPQPAAQDAVAVGEPVANSRPSLEAVFRSLSDRAYCNYIEQMRRDVCLGWEYKAAHGKFGELELKGHVLAAQQLGRHKAFREAANALRGSDAPLTHPQPAAQDAELYQFIRNCSMEDRNKLEHYSKDALDKAIRAAIAAQGEKE